MKVDFEKIGIIACYLAENTDSFYVTKFLKLCYYIDFIAYSQRGASVTNDTYYKLPYGPVPTLIKNDLDLFSNDLLEAGVVAQLSKYIVIEADRDKFGRIIKSKLKGTTLKNLSEYEANLVHSVAVHFRTTKAIVLSNQTHTEKPWLLSSDCSVIDYNLAKELDVKKILPNLE